MAVIGVAWIQETEAELDGKPPVVHIQSQSDETTLCGLSFDGMELDLWDDQGDEWPGCKRCARSHELHHNRKRD
jgi:hypothetical protein